MSSFKCSRKLHPGEQFLDPQAGLLPLLHPRLLHQHLPLEHLQDRAGNWTSHPRKNTNPHQLKHVIGKMELSLASDPQKSTLAAFNSHDCLEFLRQLVAKDNRERWLEACYKRSLNSSLRHAVTGSIWRMAGGPCSLRTHQSLSPGALEIT